MKRLTIATSVLALTGTAFAQTQWVNIPPAAMPTIPSPRAGADMELMNNGKGLLFGGQIDNVAANGVADYLNETWTFDATTLTWTNVTAAAPVIGVDTPSVRAAHEMAYDPIRNRVVMFGGWNSGVWFNETWEWDGTTWAQITPAGGVAPHRRDWMGMAFDPISQKIILQGGHHLDYWGTTGPNCEGDTWSWDGTTWTDLTSTLTVDPGLRFLHQMVTDTKRGRIVYYGGASRANSTVGAVSHYETYEWTGSDWVQVVTATLPSFNANGFEMVYDSRRERVVIFGGGNDDVFEYDGVDWTQRLPDPLPGSFLLYHTQGYYDPMIGRTVNFGGNSAANRRVATMLGAVDFYGPINDAATVSYGVACPTSVGIPAMDISDTAWVATDGSALDSYKIGVNNAPVGAPCAFLLGGGLTSIPLGIIGMPGCSLLINPVSTTVATLADGTGYASLSLAIPAVPALIGGAMFSQAAIVDAALPSPLKIASSDGARHTFGGI